MYIASLNILNDPGKKAYKTTLVRRLYEYIYEFRHWQFYSLAVIRMNDLCTRLKLTDEELKRKIWTCLEYCIMQQSQLLRDRHLDQILMCAVYVICKVSTYLLSRNRACRATVDKTMDLFNRKRGITPGGLQRHKSAAATSLGFFTFSHHRQTLTYY